MVEFDLIAICFVSLLTHQLPSSKGRGLSAALKNWMLRHQAVLFTERDCNAPLTGRSIRTWSIIIQYAHVVHKYCWSNGTDQYVTFPVRASTMLMEAPKSKRAGVGCVPESWSIPWTYAFAAEPSSCSTWKRARSYYKRLENRNSQRK